MVKQSDDDKDKNAKDSTEPSQLYGMTHKSLTTADGATGKDVAYFSHTFTLDLFFDVNRFDIEQVNGIFLVLLTDVFLEFIGDHSMSRHVCSGYQSQIPLPDNNAATMYF